MEDLQKIKEFFSKDINEQADHVAPMVAKAYKDYIKAKKDSAADVDFAEDPEKAYRYYSKKLNNTYTTRADRDAIEAILKKKYGSAMEESVNEAQFKDLQIGDEFLRFGENGQLWKKTSEKQAEFIKNIGKKTAKYNKPPGSLNVFPSTMDVTLYKSTNESVKEQAQEDPTDLIAMDVPLFLRMLEWAKEEAAEDVDLHEVTERAIEAVKLRGLLSMDDYDSLIGESIEEETGYSKYLATPENPKGKTPGLTPDIMSKILMKIANVDDIDETIRLGENMVYEELCPKGKAYIKKRMAAGEKSSAYLSGRAVKVCKGQMKG